MSYKNGGGAELLFNKKTISPLQFELDQSCKLYFVYLILTNRMQQTAWLYL
jgi:hypothetical protein